MKVCAGFTKEQIQEITDNHNRKVFAGMSDVQLQQEKNKLELELQSFEDSLKGRLSMQGKTKVLDNIEDRKIRLGLIEEEFNKRNIEFEMI